VSAEELERGRKDIETLLAELTPGFRLVGDLSSLETMDASCAAEIGRAMELCEQKGVGLVVRIIPDPRRDIGMNILSLFHYRRHPRIVTCESLAEAGRLLAL
jgi:anti-anti-sigma regulatory factor